VLEEHRTALEHERDVTNPDKLQAALRDNAIMRELLEDLL
jgi:hypothetical protein